MSNEKIEIIVSTKFLPERSDPTKSLFFFSYKVKIRNNGKNTVQLKDRYWNITDAKNNTEEIRGYRQPAYNKTWSIIRIQELLPIKNRVWSNAWSFWHGN